MDIDTLGATSGRVDPEKARIEVSGRTYLVVHDAGAVLRIAYDNAVKGVSYLNLNGRVARKVLAAFRRTTVGKTEGQS